MDDRVAEDARVYRGHVRPRITGRIPFNTPAEHTLMHDFFVQRGLKVKPHTYSFYDASTHTMHHPTPEDKPAVAKAYLGWMDKPVKLARGTNPTVLDDARTYHAANKEALGLPEWSDAPAGITVDQDRGRLAGQAFHDLEHRPNDPEVKASYEALKRETLAQYQHAVGRGAAFERWRGAGQPYTDSADMMRDVRDNKHLYYFPTEAGFGETDKFHDHPLNSEVPGMPGTRYNDLFRAIHDYYAHAAHGHQFGPQGELRAWVEHARLFSPLARKALTTETHGQNSWVNFGPHEPWRKPQTERPFADQKAGLLPEAVHPPVKLERVPSQGAAVRAQQTDTHSTRLAIAKQILQEAGVEGAHVRSVQAHTDQRGVRPGVSVALGQPVPPALSRYLAAWLGLMTGERKMTVFHPGEGEDVLHVIDSPHDQAHVGSYLRSAGVPSFTLEPQGTGTRAYVVDPMGLLNVGPAVSGLQASAHSQVPGTAVRLGDGGSDKDARHAYRTVISDAEKVNGPASPGAGTSGVHAGDSAPAQAGPGPDV